MTTRFSGAIFATAALMVWACVGSKPNESASSNAATSAPLLGAVAKQEAVPATIPSPSVLDPTTRGWEPGRRHVYTMKQTVTISFGDGTSSFDFDVIGDVDVRPVNATSESVLLYTLIRGAKIVSRVQGSQAELDKVARQIGQKGCFLTISGGRLTEIRVPKGVSPTVVNMYRTIGAGLQFASPRAAAERYTAAEYDTTGQYLAEYQSAGEPGVWRKQKQKYLALLGPKNAKASVPIRVLPQIVISEGRVTLAPSGRPTAIALHDELLVNAQTPIRSKTVLSLESTGAESAPDPSDRNYDLALADTERIGAEEPSGGPADEAALDEARTRGLNFETIVARLEQRAAERHGKDDKSAPSEARVQNQETDEDARLFIALAATFRRHPETVAKAVAKIRGESPAVYALIDALASSSSPAAQDALRKLFDVKSIKPELQGRLVMSLSRTERPTAQSIEMLKPLVADPERGTQALFGLGTFARRLRDQGEAELSRRAAEVVVAKLDAARDESETLTALRAVANSGYDPAMPKVHRYLDDDREQVRVAAVRAVQSMRDASADRIIAVKLASDPSILVRISAIDAASARGPSDILVGALAKAGTSTTDPHVRYRAVELLVQWLPQRQELRSTLETIATTDPELQIRERARGAL
jgi:hypothetical protein